MSTYFGFGKEYTVVDSDCNIISPYSFPSIKSAAEWMKHNQWISNMARIAQIEIKLVGFVDKGLYK